MLWVRISIRARCTALCDKVCQWLATGRWFSPGHPVSSTNKTDRQDIPDILLKVALNTIKQPKQTNKQFNQLTVVVYMKYLHLQMWMHSSEQQSLSNGYIDMIDMLNSYIQHSILQLTIRHQDWQNIICLY